MTNGIPDLCDRRRSFKNRRQEGPLTIQNYSKVNQANRQKKTGSAADVTKLIVESEQEIEKWIINF